MNLDELRSAQAKERRKDSLQHLRDSFYDDVGAYVADLRAARDRRAEEVENPFADDDVRRLSDEVETAEEVAEALYERRVGKVVKLASFAAADMSVDEEGMTTEERRLFDDLVERITANKSEVLDVLAGDSPAASGPSGSDDGAVPSDSPVPDGPTDATPEVADARSVADAEATDPSRSDSASADAGALAGAMGGDDGASAPGDALPEGTEGDAGPTGSDSVAPDQAEPGVPTGDGIADEPTDSETDGEKRQVPPDPAPPGAVGVDDESAETGDPADGDIPADAEPGATTDGGAVPETGPDGASPAEPDAEAESDRATVRITRDVGAIFGVDEREYELASEDVVSLPVENADPLVQRDAAERID
jgi:DNA replication factor GINS